MIKVEIVADSIGPSNVRITTFVLTYPRFIHSEFMTHRMFSRNAASSRAIPLKKTRKMVWDNPAMPVAFSKNQAGMQASETIAPWKAKLAKWLWVWTGRGVSLVAWLFEKLGIHKQHANRILEPWLHMTVVVTATDWKNFFALRRHPAAQPEFQELAREMHLHYYAHVPKKLAAREWHLPFIRSNEAFDSTEQMIRTSVARCARVSYLNHDGTHSTFEKDNELVARLLSAQPIHASPAEHQARATRSILYSGNLRGWIQYRKTLKGENVT